MPIQDLLTYLEAVRPFLSIIDVVQRQANNQEEFYWGMLVNEEIDELTNYLDNIRPLAKLLGVEFIELSESVRQELLKKLDEMTLKVVPGLTHVELEFLGEDEGLVHESVEDMRTNGQDLSGGDILSYQGKWITYRRVLELFMPFKVHPDFVSLSTLKLSEKHPNRIVFDVTHG